MDPERAESIRSHWLAYRHLATEHLLKGGVFRVPVKQKMPFPMEITETVQPVDIPIYEYRLEHGYLDDLAMTRVICEGIEVEIGPRPQRGRS